MNLINAHVDKVNFLNAASRLWDRRDVPRYRKVIFAIVHQRFCVWCQDLLMTEDLRTTHCSKICSQRHRRFNERLTKDEQRDAA